MMRVVAFAAFAGAACCWPLSAQAQFSLRDQTGDAVTPRQVISVNPFLPLFGRFQGEYERRFRENVSVAIAGSYQWFMGRSRSTAITVGGGAKRYFLSDEESRGITRVLPTARLTIGYAFS